MSDAAFKTGKYPGYTTAELTRWLANHAAGQPMLAANQYDLICEELTRRAKVKAGDVSVMTDGERLRHAEDYFDHVAALKRQGLNQDGSPRD